MTAFPDFPPESSNNPLSTAPDSGRTLPAGEAAHGKGPGEAERGPGVAGPDPGIDEHGQGEGQEGVRGRRVEALRRIWERWGVVILATALLPWLVSLQPWLERILSVKWFPVSSVPWLTAFWLVIGGAYSLAELASGSARGRWVPRRGSLILAAAILAVGYFQVALENWAMAPRREVYGSFPWYDYWPIPAGIWLWVHAGAVRERTGSVILGWGTTALLLVGFSSLYGHMGSFEALWPSWGPATKSGPTPMILSALLSPAIPVWLLAGWLVVTVPELGYVLTEYAWRRRRRRSGPLREAWGIAPFLALLPAVLPSILWIGVLGYLTTSIGVKYPSGSTRLLAEFLAVAVPLVLLPFCPRRNRRWGLYLLFPLSILFSAWELGLLGPGPMLLRVQLRLWGPVALLMGLEAWGAHKGRKELAEPTEETEAFRSLVRVLRSSIRQWGSSTRRWLFRLTPAVLLFSIFVFTYITYYLSSPASKKGVAVSLLSPIAGRDSEEFWQLAVSFCLVFVVLIPALAVVPYRWAGRFSGIWSPSGLSDLWASRLSPWEQVWAVVLPPVLLWVYTLGAILVVLVAGCSLFQGIDGLHLISFWKGVPVYWSWAGLALAGCHAFLALGILRRRIQRGMLSLVLSAGMLAAGAAGLIVLTKGLTDFVNDPFLGILVYTTGSGLSLLFAGRWALASAPRSLERVVQGE